jgi:hypothetical protein
MKTIYILILSITFVHHLSAASPSEELNPTLLEIYQLMQSQSGQSNLIGQEFEVDLTIKHATDKFIVFLDAYLQVDEDTSYQIGKWIFTPEQIKVLKGTVPSPCRVRFKVEEVRTAPPYSDMPHILARIITLQPIIR